ncbi:MAG TPA: hypothetical protein VLL52_03770 [Anaerolineae bacterium]|nr:hypothetical protein [Anaerolineae bacterium]
MSQSNKKSDQQLERITLRKTPPPPPPPTSLSQKLIKVTLRWVTGRSSSK